MDRKCRIAQVQKTLQSRPVLWYGFRGSDAAGLEAFPGHFAGSFSLTDRYQPTAENSKPAHSVALEDFTHLRRASRGFGEDSIAHEGEAQFLREFARAVEELDPWIVSYDISPELDIAMLKSPKGAYLGNEVYLYDKMNMKPRMEFNLQGIDVPTIEWEIIASIEQVKRHVEKHGSSVIRPQSGASGVGIMKITANSYAQSSYDHIGEMLVNPYEILCIASYCEKSIPLSMSGVVFPPRRNGKLSGVSRFPVSAQLIGVPELTDLPFGFCGNDYAFGSGLDANILDECDRITRRVGEYIGQLGYVGCFGVDLLLTDDQRVLFTEINPRFNGTTRVLSRVCEQAGQSDALTEHLAATLGLPFSGTPTATEWASTITPWSQMYVRSKSKEPVVLNGGQRALHVDPEVQHSNVPLPEGIAAEMVPEHDIVVEHNALLERITVNHGTLTEELTLNDLAAQVVSDIYSHYPAHYSALTDDNFAIAY